MTTSKALTEGIRIFLRQRPVAQPVSYTPSEFRGILNQARSAMDRQDFPEAEFISVPKIHTPEARCVNFYRPAPEDSEELPDGHWIRLKGRRYAIRCPIKACRRLIVFDNRLCAGARNVVDCVVCPKCGIHMWPWLDKKPIDSTKETSHAQTDRP